MNRRVAQRAILGAVLGGAVGGGLAWAFDLTADAVEVIIATSVYAAAGAVAGIASLWRERGLPPLTCVAVVAACMLVARLTTKLITRHAEGFRKFESDPDIAMLTAAVVGVIFVLACRKPVNPGSTVLENGDQDHRSAGKSSKHQGSNAQA